MDEETSQIFNEEQCSINELAGKLGCSVSKIHRLVTVGAPAIDGRFVRLAIIRTEAGRKTSVEAYRRFQIELNTREDADE
jgi:predicted transcriptional regulator